MACYHPLKAFPIGLTRAGKTMYKITPYGVDHVEQYNGIWYCMSDSFRGQYADRCVRDFVEIPCGKCIGCRIEYSRQWANRCMLELGYHDSAYFVTLTYDDYHVPTSLYGDPDTGECIPSLTLSKRDWQLFMKRLRRAFPEDKLRFFMSGEYGSETMRPHYHAIIFGLHLNDLKPYKPGPNGFQYYMSEALQLVWSSPCEGGHTPLSSTLEEFYGKPLFHEHNCDPIGMVVVSEVTWETCAYTARYVMKKLKGSDALFYEDFNIEPPFSLMSRKPGIARQWYEDHPEYRDYEYINVSTPTGGKKFRPPKYFDRLYDLECPEEMAEIKEARRRMAEASKQAKLASTDLSYEELLQVEENNLQSRLKGLVRNLE